MQLVFFAGNYTPWAPVRVQVEVDQVAKATTKNQTIDLIGSTISTYHLSPSYG